LWTFVDVEVPGTIKPGTIKEKYFSRTGYQPFSFSVYPLFLKEEV